MTYVTGAQRFLGGAQQRGSRSVARGCLAFEPAEGAGGFSGGALSVGKRLGRGGRSPLAGTSPRNARDTLKPSSIYQVEVASIANV
jgi:hypothetical protein